MKVLTVLFVCTLICNMHVFAQKTTLKYPLITQPVDERNLVTIGGVRPEVTPANDRGPVADNLPLSHMYLQLRRTPEQDRAVKELIDRLHDPKAPEYHHWLTVDQIEKQFGPAEEDLHIITGWLESHDLKVNVVYRSNGVIDFSGPASAVRGAFHTEVHNLSVKGEAHIANVSDLKIPAALAPAIIGVVSMHDFRPKPALASARAGYTTSLAGSTYWLVVPGDLATIYNFNPVYAVGVTGMGQTIAAIEDSDVYTSHDWTKFRETFGLSQDFPYGSLSQIHPQPSNNPDNGGSCADPGVNGDDLEAELDAEWASAAAPNAAVVLASCASTNTTFGAYIAVQNMLTSNQRPPSIVTISYDYSEPNLQAPPPYESYINQAYEIGVLQGVSIFVCADDEGAAATDWQSVGAENGISVNGLASTPNDVAVGGTDFGDYYLHETSTYWNATNGQYFNSALSYVPEIPWNSTCASQLVANFLGFATTYGADGFCNSAFGEEFLEVVAGGGGASSCAFGIPSIYGPDPDIPNGYYAVVSGTCRGFPKPSYQYVVPGNPNDGVRDLPDVSMFAANGLWYHTAVVCFSDPSNGGYPCTGSPANWWLGAGTSLATPVMAGIQALINEASTSYQGNPNYVLYALGASEYDSGGASACDATLGNQIKPNCIFHDVTLGDTDVPCLPLVVNGITIGKFNCYLPSGTYGVLSLSNSSYEPAYPATRAWDFATGLGSVNAYNLVRAWPGSRVP